MKNELKLFNCSVLPRFLATGESFRSLAFQFRIHHTWISRIVHPTLAAVVNNLTDIAMPKPTEELWKKMRPISN